MNLLQFIKSREDRRGIAKLRPSEIYEAVGISRFSLCRARQKLGIAYIQRCRRGVTPDLYSTSIDVATLAEWAKCASVADDVSVCSTGGFRNHGILRKRRR